MRPLLPLLLLAACEPEADGRSGLREAGELHITLPGPPSQHHARVACGWEDCLVARQVGGTVGFTRVEPDGTLHEGIPAPQEVEGWNHPEIRATREGSYVVVAATRGAPQMLTLGPDGTLTGGPHPLHEPWPWGLWPDFAVDDEGNALAFWSTKTDPYWLAFDPTTVPPTTPETFELALDQATVDPPAVGALPWPYGFVRAWTVKNGFTWQVRLQWTDLEGQPVGEPVIVAEGEGTSRGARPQVAVGANRDVAVSWRVWPDTASLPEGAFVRVYDRDHQPKGPTLRLDPDDAGDRPTVLAVWDSFLVAWEQGTPEAVHVATLDPNGTRVNTPWRVSDSGDIPAGRAALALRPDGRAWVSWEEVSEKRGDQVVQGTIGMRAIIP